MEPRRHYKCILVVYISIIYIVTTLFPPCGCDAISDIEQMLKFEGSKLSTSSLIESTKKLKVSSHMDIDPPLDPSDTEQPYASPFSLPPFDSIAPLALPQNEPPFCVYPPFNPQPPSTTMPSPRSSKQPPPPLYFPPTVPIHRPPPATPVGIPSPPTYSPVPNPPEFEPSPPGVHGPSPPCIHGPSPPKHVPSPPVFQPPVVHPPPSVPPPPNKVPGYAIWCVAKPTVPDPIVQEAMDYACGAGADCESIKPNGSCYQPNTMFAHASYAFNSYWQRTKVAGGTCDFGGTGMLVTVDPSFDGCHFIYY